MFANPVAQRLYRNNILPASTLLLFGSYIGIFLRRDYPLKKLVPWSIISSIALVFFWHIKEDSIWVLPFISILTLICIGYWVTKKRRRILIACLIPIAPFITLLCFNTIYRTINYNTYGVYAISDRSSGSFASMAGSLISIEDPENSDSRIWVSQESLKRAAKASPTFASIKKALDEYSGWTDPNGEVRGDWIIWKIRTVMADLGYYESATKADEFCQKVADELKAAFENGTLQKDHKLHISSNMRGLNLNEDLPIMLSNQLNWFFTFSNYRDIETTNTAGTANIDLAVKVQNFTNSSTVFPGTQYYNKAVVYANRITKLYQKLSPVFTILGIIAFIGMLGYTIFQIFKKNFTNIDITLVTIGIALSFIMIISEVIIFAASFYDDSVNGHPANLFYSAPILPLIQLFKYIPLMFMCEKISPLAKNILLKNTAKPRKKH